MSGLPPQGSHVAVYARDASTEELVNEAGLVLSVADQTALCCLFAEGHGWDVVATYSDQRSDVVPREGLMNLLLDVAHQKFDVLLVRDLDRIGLDVGFVQQVLNMLGAGGVVVGVVQDPPLMCADCALADQAEDMGDE